MIEMAAVREKQLLFLSPKKKFELCISEKIKVDLQFS
jgi:hypothetical protein